MLSSRRQERLRPAFCRYRLHQERVLIAKMALAPRIVLHPCTNPYLRMVTGREGVRHPRDADRAVEDIGKLPLAANVDGCVGGVPCRRGVGAWRIPAMRT
jgi:hypothetical protein